MRIPWPVVHRRWPAGSAAMTLIAGLAGFAGFAGLTVGAPTAHAAPTASTTTITVNGSSPGLGRIASPDPLGLLPAPNEPRVRAQPVDLLRPAGTQL